MFDSNAMNELKHHAADRYQRAGGGGSYKVHATSAAFHKSRGYDDMTPFQQATYRARVAFQQAADQIKAELAFAPIAAMLAREERDFVRQTALRTIPF